MKLFISILTLLFLFGCSPQEETPVANEEVVEVTEEVNEEINEVKKDADVSFRLGILNGNTYVNESLNITVTLPKDFEVVSTEQMEELMEVSLAEIDENDSLENYELFYEYMAFDYENYNNIIILAETAQPIVLNESIYLNSMIQNIKNSPDETSTVELDENIYQRDFGGNTFHCFDMSSTISDFTLVQTVCVLKYDSKIFNITTTAQTKESLEDILSSIENLN